MAKYLYIDIPFNKDRSKDLSNFKVGDQIEVCLYELFRLHTFFKDIGATCKRLKCTINIEYFDGDTYDGYQVITFVKEATDEECPKCGSDKVNDIGYSNYNCSDCMHSWVVS